MNNAIQDYPSPDHVFQMQGGIKRLQFLEKSYKSGRLGAILTFELAVRKFETNVTFFGGS